jgi:hypothetical protein
MEALKPCPFCGQTAKLIKHEVDYCRYAEPYYDVGCTNSDCYLCDGAEWQFKTPEEAVELWNKRDNND